MIMDGDRVVASRFGVAVDKIVEVAAELQRHTAPGLRVEVDGRDIGEALAALAKNASLQEQEQERERRDASHKAPPRGKMKTAELSNHMLWESFARSCEVQGYMLDKMTGCAVEMNRRFVQELETMRANYTKALEKIDGMQFEHRMLEHEAASRRLSNHFVRMAEEDHRAAERRRIDDQSVFEQIARGVMRVVDVIGGDSIDGKH